MICFGTAVGPRDSYEQLALPSLRQVAECEDAILAIRGAPSLSNAYNALIKAALAGFPDTEAIVLANDDVPLQNRNLDFRSLLTARFRCIECGDCFDIDELEYVETSYTHHCPGVRGPSD
jgi:hypothetical protein